MTIIEVNNSETRNLWAVLFAQLEWLHGRSLLSLITKIVVVGLYPLNEI